MIYLDSSALVKLLFSEPESEALSSWLSARAEQPKLTSQVSVVEVVRTCRRVDAEVEPAARRLLAGLDLVPISQAVVVWATHAGSTSLRSLDAIQLATALTVREDLDSVITYDRRLLGAAESERLPVASPA
ncbi:MAG TPA: type II toxin-antitoxin system VapC family toxin [Candidatus Saccharimonadales bacterium]|nr:type II toxin-antitoxin system VapC family toxin [Candidatus Saccharimonadales bacterium]